MTGLLTFGDLEIEDYRTSSAVSLGRRLARGELSPVQVTECALHLAELFQSTTNAYAAILRDRALRSAAALEAELAGGRCRSAIAGVPIAVKDNFHLEGQPTGKGSLTSPDSPAAESAPMVRRLLDAGAVVIGTTTTPEFGWKGTGISPRTGVTRNPWNPAKNSGGSSAGSGATVASGAVPIATGTDAGGSVRIPASFCGIVGFKPTLGAIPVWPGTVNESLSHAGPMCRSVEDVAVVMDLTRGPEPRDPQSYWSRQVAEDLARRFKVGVIAAPFGIAPEPGVAEVFASAVAALSEVAELSETALPGNLPHDIFETLWVTGRGLGFRDLFDRHAAIMDPGLVRLGALAQEYRLVDYFSALTARRHFNAAMAGVFDHWDLVIMPTMPLTAFAADAEAPVGGDLQAKLPWIEWTPYTYPFNITGQPAISIPCGFADGLPIGLQIVGPWAHDQRVVSFAQRCEQAIGLGPDQRVAPLV